MRVRACTTAMLFDFAAVLPLQARPIHKQHYLKRMVVVRPEELEIRAKTRPSRLPCIIRLTSTCEALGKAEQFDSQATQAGQGKVTGASIAA